MRWRGLQWLRKQHKYALEVPRYSGYGDRILLDLISSYSERRNKYEVWSFFRRKIEFFCICWSTSNLQINKVKEWVSAEIDTNLWPLSSCFLRKTPHGRGQSCKGFICVRAGRRRLLRVTCAGSLATPTHTTNFLISYFWFWTNYKRVFVIMGSFILGLLKVSSPAIPIQISFFYYFRERGGWFSLFIKTWVLNVVLGLD